MNMKRVVIFDDWNGELLDHVPNHDDYHVWVRDDSGDGWTSDIGYTLDDEEFGPVPEHFGRIIARSREESEPCTRGTDACSIDHETEISVGLDSEGCEPW